MPQSFSSVENPFLKLVSTLNGNNEQRLQFRDGWFLLMPASYIVNDWSRDNDEDDGRHHDQNDFHEKQSALFLIYEWGEQKEIGNNPISRLMAYIKVERKKAFVCCIDANVVHIKYIRFEY